MSRKILITATVLGLLLVAGLIGAAHVRLLDMRGPLAGRLSSLSGREISIAGPITLRLGLLPGVKVEEILVGGSSGGSPLNRARIGRGEIVLALWPLVMGRVEVHRLELDDVELWLERPVVGEAGAAESPASLDRSFDLARVEARHLRIELDSHVSPTTLALAAHAKGMRLERLVAQLDETGAYSGQVHARVDLRSRGDSLHALASNLDGEVAASIDAGSISVEHSSLLTRDVVRAIRSAVHYRKSELLNCMIAGFHFRDGVGTAEHVVLDSEDIVVRAEGTVDLGAEEIQMRLVPRLHHPSLLSTAGTVQLTGYLEDPQVKLEKGSLLRSMGEAFVANVVTLSGLRKLWLLLTGREFTGSHCERLLADPNDPNG